MKYTMSFKRKKGFLFFIFVAAFFFATFLFAKVSYAAVTPLGEGSFQNYQNQRNAKIQAATENNTTLVEVGGATGEKTKASMGSIICQLMNCDPAPTPVASGMPNTAIDFVGHAIKMVYANPPARLSWYVQDTLAHAGLAKPVYAQGIGFAGLSPFLSIWKATRNVAYIILVIVMVAIGFMIIFRMKIDPKTVISVQAAIPRIVLTIILITFSYAIVGFLIDMMYLMMAIAIQIAAEGMGEGFSEKVPELQNLYMNGGLGVLFNQVASVGMGGALKFIGSLWEFFIAGSAISTGLIFFIGLLGTVSWWLAPLLALPEFIVLLIALLGVLYTFIRLWFLLFNSYIQIILALLLGPLLLLAEAIPGRSAFGNWIKSIIANLIVFPMTVVLLMFCTFLFSLGGRGDAPWQPPLLGGLLGPGSIFPIGMGLAALFASPSIIAQVKKMLHPTSLMPITMGTAISPLTGAAGTTMGAASQFYYMKATIDQIRGQHK